MADSNKMTKDQLVAWYVDRGVEKWGEAERTGLQKQAAKKSLAALRGDYDMAAAARGELTTENVMDRASSREHGPTRYQAAHCNAAGPT